MSDVLSILSSLREGIDDDLQPLFYQLEDQWDRKLWHQLTQTLFEIFKDPRTASLRIPLYERFVSRFENQINQLALATFAVSASEQFATPSESLEFMRGVSEKFQKKLDESKDSVITSSASASSINREVYVFTQLREASLFNELGELVQTKKILDNARSWVDEMVITDKAVLAQFYGISCEYFKKQNEYTSYYRNALLYLACINLDAFSKQQQQQRAFDLCLAALLATKIYNFGELILHPVLRSLEDPEYRWLQELVEAVNSGDVPRFQQLRPVFTAKSPLLQNSLPFLEQKICLMALCECVFKRQSTERTLSFTTIARETHLQVGAKVEVLVMKAFSLGLMRGSIDEVDKTVSVSWLQPRVLSRDQMATMRARLGEWDEEVKKLGAFIQEKGQDVWQAV